MKFLVSYDRVKRIETNNINGHEIKVDCLHGYMDYQDSQTEVMETKDIQA